MMTVKCCRCGGQYNLEDNLFELKEASYCRNCAGHLTKLLKCPHCDLEHAVTFNLIKQLKASPKRRPRESVIRKVERLELGGASIDVPFSRWADANRNWIAPPNAKLIAKTGNDYILSTLILTHKGPEALAYKLRWRDVTDEGSFADVGATGEVTYDADTVLEDNTAVIAGEAFCGHPCQSGMTWQNGLENEGNNLCPDSGTYSLADEYFSELHWALSFDDAEEGHIYELQLYDITNGAILATLLAQIEVYADYSEQTIYPSKDSFMDEFTSGTNYGNQPYLSIENRNNSARRILIEFDLSDAPETGAVKEAMLWLYCYADVFGSVDCAQEAFRILASWNETGVTWSNQPAHDSEVKGTSYDHQKLGWDQWVLTSSVKEFIDETYTNYGWKIIYESESAGASVMEDFRSKEYSGETYDPRLIIKYVYFSGSVNLSSSFSVRQSDAVDLSSSFTRIEVDSKNLSSSVTIRQPGADDLSSSVFVYQIGSTDLSSSLYITLFGSVNLSSSITLTQEDEDLSSSVTVRNIGSDNLSSSVTVRNVGSAGLSSSVTIRNSGAVDLSSVFGVSQHVNLSSSFSIGASADLSSSITIVLSSTTKLLVKVRVKRSFIVSRGRI